MGRKKAMLQMYKSHDVFNAIRIEGSIWPLGSYIRKKLREALGISQNALERAIQFDNFNEETGELYELPVLPENYSPETDFFHINSPWRKKHGQKAEIAELPNLRKKAAHRARQTVRRTIAGSQV